MAVAAPRTSAPISAIDPCDGPRMRMRLWSLCCLVACSAPAAPRPTPPQPSSPATPEPAPAPAPAPPPAASRYPAATRGDVVETKHGVAVADPYRWLEEMESPATRAWVAEQNKLADEHAGKIQIRERLKARIAELLSYEKVGIPSRRGKHYYWTYHDGRKG